MIRSLPVTPCLRAAAAAVAVAVVCLLGTAAAARAAPATTADVEKLIKRGNELRTAGKDHEALPLFQRAYETTPTTRTAAQLGLCEMQLGYWLAAESHLKESLAGQRDPWMNRYRATIEEALRGTQRQLGDLLVTGSPAGASVVINGRKAGTLPLDAVRVVAGPVRVEVFASGHEERRETVVVAAESQARLTVNLPRVAAVAVSQPEGDPPRQPGDAPDDSQAWGAGKTTGVVLVGAGVLAVAGGVTLLLLDKRQSCDLQMAGDQCQQRTRTHVPGWTLLGAGVAAGLVGGIVIYTSSSEVAVAVGPSSLFLSGRF